MSYYLVFLLASFLSKLFGTISYHFWYYIAFSVHIAYAAFYIFKDIVKSLRGVKGVHIELLLTMIVFLFIVIPALEITFLCLDGFAEHEAHLLWICTVIFYILIWWLWAPYHYRPLTRLAELNADSTDNS